MKLLSNILAPVSCVTVAEGTQLLGLKFLRIFELKKIEKRKKTVAQVRTQRQESDSFR